MDKQEPLFTEESLFDLIRRVGDNLAVKKEKVKAAQALLTRHVAELGRLQALLSALESCVAPLNAPVPPQVAEEDEPGMHNNFGRGDLTVEQAKAQGQKVPVQPPPALTSLEHAILRKMVLGKEYSVEPETYSMCGGCGNNTYVAANHFCAVCGHKKP